MLSTVDLLVLTRLDQLLLIMKSICTFLKQTTLMRRLTVLGLSLQKGFPGLNILFLFMFCSDSLGQCL
jgi:hypothetical protein